MRAGPQRSYIILLVMLQAQTNRPEPPPLHLHDSLHVCLSVCLSQPVYLSLSLLLPLSYVLKDESNDINY